MPNNQIILDKMLINLHLIALQSKQNDNLFKDLLHEKIGAVFKLFALKKQCLKKRTESSQSWKNLISEILSNDPIDWIDNSLKSVSFFGLDEAVKHHCGIEIDRIETSEIFAKNILLIMKDLINEKNVDESEKFILSQPHFDDYLNSFVSEKCSQIDSYSPCLFRENSNLDLNKKIKLFKRHMQLCGTEGWDEDNRQCACRKCLTFNIHYEGYRLCQD